MLKARPTIDFTAFKMGRACQRAQSLGNFPDALKQLPRGVGIITFGKTENFGLTTTSVSSLSREPPTILVSIDRSIPLSEEFLNSQSFGVSVLCAGQDELAQRFARGAAISEDDDRSVWSSPDSGVPLLAGAIAAFDCDREDIMECHGHAIVVGKVRGVRVPGKSSALVYWRGTYNQVGWTEDEICRAVGVTPPAVDQQAMVLPRA
jgi:flavin reductase (DIM6/NTAB) family NADH-FMN oxidoreductase RutF